MNTCCFDEGEEGEDEEEQGGRKCTRVLKSSPKVISCRFSGRLVTWEALMK